MTTITRRVPRQPSLAELRRLVSNSPVLTRAEKQFGWYVLLPVLASTGRVLSDFTSLCRRYSQVMGRPYTARRIHQILQAYRNAGLLETVRHAHRGQSAVYKIIGSWIGRNMVVRARGVLSTRIHAAFVAERSRLGPDLSQRYDPG